jgi:ligand-binding SRPBCC domain-containing protein
VKTYLVKTEQAIPISLDEAWDFFSSPANLEKITPKKMNLVVTSVYSGDDKIYPGMIITYKVSPVLGIKMNWMTEITHVKQGAYFADEQRFGPFALWHHQHHFKTIKGGVLMTDILNYAIPYGVIGRFINTVLVAKQIKKIFNYREKAIVGLFGALEQKAKS